MSMLRRIRRAIRFWWQRVTRGWDDEETWNLDVTIARFALPRLKQFKSLTRGAPVSVTDEEWHVALDDMIWAFEHYDYCIPYDRETQARVQKGLDLFAKYFWNLWW